MSRSPDSSPASPRAFPFAPVGLRAWAGPAIVFALTLVCQLPFFARWFNFMDEGHMVQFADMQNQGLEFYRDATFYPLPGAFFFLAWMFRIFGASVLVSRWIVVVEFALFVAIVFALLQRSVPRPWPWLGVVFLLLYRVWGFPHWHIYSYSTTALLVFLLTAFVLLHALETHDRRWLALSGLLYGVGVACKQDYGFAALLTLLPLLVLGIRTAQPRERLLPALGLFIGPAGAVGAVVGLYYLHLGILDELIQFVLLNHFVGMSSYEYTTFPDVLPLFTQDEGLRTKLGIITYLPGLVFTADWPVVRNHWLFNDTILYDTSMKLFFFGPYLLVAFALGRVVWIRERLADPANRTRTLVEILFAFFAAALVLLVTLNRPQDYLHLAVLYWPLLGLSVIYLEALYRKHRRAFVVFCIVWAIPTAAMLAYTGRLLDLFYEMHDSLVPGERAGIYATATEAQMLGDVIDYMKSETAPGDKVAVMPYFPILNFLAERNGPHRSSYILWPFPEFPDRDARVVEAMTEQQTDVVIYNFTQFYSFPPVWEYAPGIFEMLVEDYEIDRVFSYDEWGYKLAALRRRKEPRAGRPLLAEGAELGVWQEQEGGPPVALPPEEVDRVLRFESWPFRPAITLRPSAKGRTSVLRVRHRVDEAPTKLVTAVSVHPQWWFKLPPTKIEFRIRVLAEGGERVVYDRTLNPTKDLADRRWFEVEVALDEWAGQEIWLELATEADKTRGETTYMGGWAEPRIVAGRVREADDDAVIGRVVEPARAEAGS